MGGIDFKEPLSKEDESEESVRYNTRIGLILFFVYVIFYGSFMLISAFFPQIMSNPSLGGVNLSIVSGFGLIVLALILALLYMKLCKKSNVGGEK